MAHKSGQCKTPECSRAQQPGTNGYCSRCFKIHNEKQNTQILDTMNKLLVNISAQFSELSKRVDDLESPSVVKETKQSSVAKDDTDIFVPSLDTSTDTVSIIPKKDTTKSKNMDLAVKKLKIIKK